MPRRRKDRIDDNQTEIVKALRSIPGVGVMTGMDDILVGYKGVTYWFEIKDPAKTVNKDGTWKHGALKDCQIDLLATWPGQYDIVTTLEQILVIVGITGSK